MKVSDLVRKSGGIFLPIALLNAGLISDLYWQLRQISDQRSNLHLMVTVEDAPKAQAEQVETKAKALLGDLVQLAKSGDPNAVAIVKKYNISEQPAGAPNP